MKALMFDRLGTPADVVGLRDIARPRPGSGEVLVRLLLSPIIPGDALYTQGLYPEPVRPRLPGAIAGNYGVGHVVDTGDATRVPIGSLVAVTYHGLWADYATAPVSRVVVLPPDYPPALGAEFMNLVTASDLLAQGKVEAGQWLIITGGHASVPALIAQYARAAGVRTLAIIRRRRAELDLGGYGANAVLALDEVDDIGAGVRDVTGGGAHGLIDCVGGPLLPELLKTLCYGAQTVVYGGLDAQPFQLHNFDLLLNGLAVSTYIYRYFRVSPATEPAYVEAMLSAALDIDVRAPVAGHFTLDEAQKAFAVDGAPGRRYFAWPKAVADIAVASEIADRRAPLAQP